MRIKSLLLIVLVCLISANGQTRKTSRSVRPVAVKSVKATSNAQELPIRRVVLYSNGVAYIERRGIVSGNTEVNLSFKQSQIDDVLKSMIVVDLGEGRIGAVSYNSSAPPSARMAEIPFSVNPKTNEAGGIAGVLEQLQGAKVLVTSTKGTASGAILTVEKRQVKDEKKTAITHFLVIASANGEISNFNLADVRSVKLLDKDTKRDVNEFANASALSRRRDAKTITVTSEGTNRRELIVSYTIAAPIWKTTYRVVLDDEGKPFFQGWAIVDNVSEESWENIQLSLVSGAPVSFIQNIQKPLYRYRPVVPIPKDLKLEPQVYEDELSGGTGYGVGSGSGSGNGSGSGRVNGSRSSKITTNLPINGRTSFSNLLAMKSSGVETAATGNELGDLFEYKIARPVTVPRDRSALIPIIQTKMDGERVSIYNERVNSSRPMSGMLLTNTSNLTFENGSLTVIDRDAYAGESLMERLKPKEKRLISFALDLGTRISAEQKQKREPAKLIKIVRGVFQAHYFLQNEKTYHLVNQTNRTKVIWVEHPKRRKWILSQHSPKPDLITENFYRFRVELKPFERQKLNVYEKLGLMDSYQLSTLSKTNLGLFVAERYIDEKTRGRLEKLIELRTKIGEIDKKLANLTKEETTIAITQKRLRENIKVLTKTAEAKQLITRYVQKANNQETRIEEIGQERRALNVEKERLSQDLQREIKNFDLEQKAR